MLNLEPDAPEATSLAVLAAGPQALHAALAGADAATLMLVLMTCLGTQHGTSRPL